jgi:O-antigen/teichoic acid export membrane protein
VLFLAEGVPGKEATVQWIGAPICLAAYFLLIPRYGAMGAAVSTLLTFIVIAIVSMVWVHSLYPYHLEAVRLAKLAAITGGLLAVHFLLPISSLAGQIGLGLLLLAAFPALMILLSVPNQSEWDSAVTVLRRLTGTSATTPL